ncbi:MULTISPECIES: START-like domain-containing protein [unclassified Porphyromonas]|uniref:START-like domain-containing protein n=1 Tax=unclassified Porphyromonas TaxID=2645799 RepID=UPI000694668F|nr:MULTISPECIES: START-like domain-containing protein [unclassified Porphyromonas]
MTKKEFQLEYTFENVSVDRLWRRISTENGLRDWITGQVSIRGDRVRFVWGAGDVDEAYIHVVETGRQIRYDWIGEDAYFELKIVATELTGDKTLVITDFCEDGDLESTVEIWEVQIGRLRRVMGLSQI